jgi:FolB domain-containing protein
MDSILIKDLLARGIIGVGEEERTRPQDILINLVVYTDTTVAGYSDRIEDCVNYSTLSKKILAHAEKAARYTVEALAADIARLCLEIPLVIGVRVRVEKPGAVRFTHSVGVEIERMKD